jgi:hypothetical protein
MAQSSSAGLCANGLRGAMKNALFGASDLWIMVEDVMSANIAEVAHHFLRFGIWIILESKAIELIYAPLSDTLMPTLHLLDLK